MFQQVVHKGGESEINYIKIFQNAKALSISVRNIYTGDKLIQTCVDNFQQGGNYSAHIEKHQAELKRKEDIIDQKSLSTSDLQINYLNLVNLVRNNEREHFARSRFSHCGVSCPTEK